ncbi:MAG TPA: HD domain-containing phosphohydrolase, partial [Bacillota bacterium]|nr:HD domain-containing phosphohydrolase [Bacillota bacterium]
GSTMADIDFFRPTSAKNQYETIAELCDDAIFLETPQGEILNCNSAACRIYGYTREQILQLNASALIAADPHGLVEKVVEGVWNSDIRVRATNLKKDGTVFPVEITFKNIQIDDRELILVYCKDRSTQEQMEEALVESEERWKFALEGSGDGVWDWAVPTNKCYFSGTFKQILGYESDAHFSEEADWKDKVHPDDVGWVTAAIDRHLYGETPSFAGEYQIRCKDGTYKWVLDRAKVVSRTPDGKPLRMVGTLTDISQRKKDEEKIRYLSFHDMLTGLYNRAYFEEQLAKLDVESMLPISIILGDLNGLKFVNDVFGHFEGDELLARMAEILKKSCRTTDIVARWGGDEFAVILPKTSEEEAGRLCERIKHTCSVVDNSRIHHDISLGCAAKTAPEESIQTIIKQAEDRMYRHKLLAGKSQRSNYISLLRNTLLERNVETEEHARRSVEMAQKIGRKMGLSEVEIDELSLLATLHDIGKIAISDNILLKPGQLTAQEWIEMKKHSEIGYRIAKSSNELAQIAEYILAHHERWDGQGYPRGLRGEEIPKLARIIAVIDAYDVMTHERPYKQFMSEREAVEELKSCAGTQFDPDMVMMFTQVHPWK